MDNQADFTKGGVVIGPIAVDGPANHSLNPEVIAPLDKLSKLFRNYKPERTTFIEDIVNSDEFKESFKKSIDEAMRKLFTPEELVTEGKPITGKLTITGMMKLKSYLDEHGPLMASKCIVDTIRSYAKQHD